MRATGGRQNGAGIGNRGVNNGSAELAKGEKTVEFLGILKYDDVEKVCLEGNRNG